MDSPSQRLDSHVSKLVHVLVVLVVTVLPVSFITLLFDIYVLSIATLIYSSICGGSGNYIVSACQDWSSNNSQNKK